MNEIAGPLPALLEYRRRKVTFDSTWTLGIVLAAVIVIASWYLRLIQIDVAPVIWTLGGLAAAQYGANALAERCVSIEALRWYAIASHVLGVGGMAVAWHLIGGLQQPTFPLLVLLPLLSGAAIFNFWQHQFATVALLLMLLSGVALSPDANSFIEQRYGFDLGMLAVLPQWLPRSSVVFADVNTTPAYNLMMMGTTALLAIALSASARAIVSVYSRDNERTQSLQAELNKAQQLNLEMITHAPTSEVLLASTTGRIVHASERFSETFGASNAVTGKFLLDCVTFAYPAVIKRLMATGGEEIQGANVAGREVVLRVRAGYIDLGSAQVVRLSLESCDDICWRGAVDALTEPVFAVNGRGNVIFLNRSAVTMFGAQAEGSEASSLFDADRNLARWWDIAPLQSARRIIDSGGRRYLAAIRRERIAESIGELMFVHLLEREHENAYVAAAS